MEAPTNGIELTGTLYTSAQGDAKDKLAYAELIWDNDLQKYQSDINKESSSTKIEELKSEVNSIKLGFKVEGETLTINI